MCVPCDQADLEGMESLVVSEQTGEHMGLLALANAVDIAEKKLSASDSTRLKVLQYICLEVLLSKHGSCICFVWSMALYIVHYSRTYWISIFGKTRVVVYVPCWTIGSQFWSAFSCVGWNETVSCFPRSRFTWVCSQFRIRAALDSFQVRNGSALGW